MSSRKAPQRVTSFSDLRSFQVYHIEGASFFSAERFLTRVIIVNQSYVVVELLAI